MCTKKQIADIDSGKSIVMKKGWLYTVSLVLGSGVLAWLLSIVFWVSGTNFTLAEHTDKIEKIETETEEMFQQQDEMIYNLSRLLESNGLDWKSFKK